MRQKLYRYMRTLSLRTMITIFCSAFVLLLIAMSALFYFTSTRKARMMTISNASALTEQATQNLNRKLEQLRQSAAASITDSYLFLQMQQNIASDREPISAKNYTRLAQAIQNFVSQNQQDVSTAFLMLSDNSIVLTVSGYSGILRYQQPEYKILLNTFSADDLTWIYRSDAEAFLTTQEATPEIGLIQMLGDESSSLHGLFYIGLSDEAIKKELAQYRVTNESIFTLALDGQILFHDPEYFSAGTYSQLTSTDFLSIQEATEEADNKHPIFLDLSHSYALYSPMDPPPLSVISILPKDELFLDNAELSSLLLAEAGGGLLLCLILFAAATRLLSAPAEELARQLNSIETLPQLTAIQAAGGKEFQLITEAINHLSFRIHGLVRSLTQEMTWRRNAELEALYAQINPHFLYNTLDSIGQLCELGESVSACQMVRELSDFYRIGVSKGENLISLKEELLHVSSYLSILQTRFEDFSFQIQAPESLENVLVPKIILQPLAENAVYHGIRPFRPDGTILISAQLTDDMLELLVTDNGCGMEEERLSALNAALASSASHPDTGYGLRNVHQRILLQYGPPYGLSVFSQLDEGTAVKILLPIHSPTNTPSAERKEFHVKDSFCG